jgi:phage major head subunit gpT-like protein
MALNLLDSTTGQLLFTQFSAQYQAAYKAGPQVWDQFSTLMPSTTSTNLYHWIAQLPGMREWVGSRQMHSAVLRNYSLTNREFEASIKLNKFLVADDQHGAFGVTVEAHAQSVARWRDERMAAAVEAATTTEGYDGQYFFSAAHPVSLDDSALGTYSNLLTGASYNLAADPIGVWQAASELMATYKGDSNKPLGLMANALMVPPQLRRWAVQAAKAELVPQTFTSNSNANASAAAVSNVYIGDFVVIVNPYLTTAAAYVMCLDRAVKPFIWQERQSPMFTALVDPTLPNMFAAKEFIYGDEARGAEGYSLPFLAVRCAA